MKTIIRKETPRDYREVENLVRESFWNVYRPGCLEHFVIHSLRNDPAFVKELDFVMEQDGRIIGQNMFNFKPAKKTICKTGRTNWHGESSYIRCVRWGDFIKNTESYIDASYERQKNIADYDIHIKLT